MSPFRRFALLVLGYNVIAVLWGALVRATGSGAGCGAHWPLCNGTVIPRTAATETLVEFTHRVMSGVALALVAALVVWAVRTLPRGSAARRAAAASGAFIVLEALVGAALVLFGWVARDDSAARGGVVVVHLATTFLLLGSIALTFALADRPGALTLRGREPFVAALGLGLASLLVAGASGAVAALGDTLYPSSSLLQGLATDLGDQGPFLLRLRLVHPFASLAAAVVVAAIGAAVLRTRDPRLRGPGLRLLALVGAQLVAGALNLALLAPIWMQLLHLALADLTWIALVLLAAASLTQAPEVVTGQRGRAAAGV